MVKNSDSSISNTAKIQTMYKKIGKNWRHTEYDEKNINKTKVYDLFFDKDGCMIASTQNGIMKQLHQESNN